jgi:hypothetical protein
LLSIDGKYQRKEILLKNTLSFGNKTWSCFSYRFGHVYSRIMA